MKYGSAAEYWQAIKENRQGLSENLRKSTRTHESSSSIEEINGVSKDSKRW